MVEPPVLAPLTKGAFILLFKLLYRINLLILVKLILGGFFMKNSYWIDSVNFKSFPKLDKDLEVDVCIVGGRNYWSFYCLLFIKKWLRCMYFRKR